MVIAELSYTEPGGIILSVKNASRSHNGAAGMILSYLLYL